jgi:adenylylsulfate kinase
MDSYKDARHRSILKALSWRICASITTMLIFFAFTGRLVLALGAGAVEIVVKLVLYYLHERTWICLCIGRKEHPLSSLPVNKSLTGKDMDEVRMKLKELGYISKD